MVTAIFEGCSCICLDSDSRMLRNGHCLLSIRLSPEIYLTHVIVLHDDIFAFLLICDLLHQVKFLLYYGADVNIKESSQGNTPLHIAVHQVGDSSLHDLELLPSPFPAISDFYSWQKRELVSVQIMHEETTTVSCQILLVSCD